MRLAKILPAGAVLGPATPLAAQGMPLTAGDTVRRERFAARGTTINQLVAISFAASRMGAERGVFRFSLSAAAPDRRQVLDSVPADGRPRGTALIQFKP
jgi:hypothetical protein